MLSNILTDPEISLTSMILRFAKFEKKNKYVQHFYMYVHNKGML